MKDRKGIKKIMKGSAYFQRKTNLCFEADEPTRCCQHANLGLFTEA